MEVMSVIIGAIFGVIGIYSTKKIYEVQNRSKVKINIIESVLEERQTPKNWDRYDIRIENVSDYDLYDFTIEIKEKGVLLEPVEEKLSILKTSFPLPIGQVYRNFIFKSEDICKKTDCITFLVKYKEKPNARKYKKNEYLFPVVLFNRLRMTDGETVRYKFDSDEDFVAKVSVR